MDKYSAPRTVAQPGARSGPGEATLSCSSIIRTPTALLLGLAPAMLTQPQATNKLDG